MSRISPWLLGLLFLGLMIGGVAMAARESYRASPEASSGAIAVAGAWMTHSLLDWDWEMPAVTMLAIVCAGALIALADRGSPVRSRNPPRAERVGATR